MEEEEEDGEGERGRGRDGGGAQLNMATHTSRLILLTNEWERCQSAASAAPHYSRG